MDLPTISLDFDLGDEAPPCDGASRHDHRPADAPCDGAADGSGDAKPGRALALVPPADDLPETTLTIGAGVSAAHWAALCWESLGKKVTNPRGPWHSQPESMADHARYVKSRAWVPAASDGKFAGPAGAWYHRTIGRGGLLAGYLLAWTFGRPVRLAGAVVIIGGIWLGFQFG